MPCPSKEGGIVQYPDPIAGQDLMVRAVARALVRVVVRAVARAVAVARVVVVPVAVMVVVVGVALIKSSKIIYCFFVFFQ